MFSARSLVSFCARGSFKFFPSGGVPGDKGASTTRRRHEPLPALGSLARERQRQRARPACQRPQHAGCPPGSALGTGSACRCQARRASTVDGALRGLRIVAGAIGDPARHDAAARFATACQRSARRCARKAMSMPLWSMLYANACGARFRLRTPSATSGESAARLDSITTRIGDSKP